MKHWKCVDCGRTRITDDYIAYTECCGLFMRETKPTKWKDHTKKVERVNIIKETKEVKGDKK